MDINLLAFNGAINNIATKGYEAESGHYMLDYGNLLAFVAEYERLKCEKIKEAETAWDGYRDTMFQAWAKTQQPAEVKDDFSSNNSTRGQCLC